MSKHVVFPSDEAERLRELMSMSAGYANFSLPRKDAEELVRVAQVVIDSAKEQLAQEGKKTLTGILGTYGLDVKELDDFPDPDDRFGSFKVPVWRTSTIHRYIREHPELGIEVGEDDA